MTKNRHVSLLLAISSFAFCIPASSQPPKAEFMSLESAQPVLRTFSATLPPELRNEPNEVQWQAWVQAQDASIRQRLVTGEEDTLTNLLRFGVSYTKEYQIDREYLAKYGNSTLVNAFAENRANDLIHALASSNANEGIKQMRAFLIQRGYSFKTTSDRARVKKLLLDNLARMRDEFAQFHEELQSAGPAEASHVYAQRGISLDSNLWPDYALDRTLAELVNGGLLKPGSIRRIAIIGPGLDFANKEYGNDFYPPQSIQPFAVLDSLIRLGLTDPKSYQLYTLDISPSVNIHLARAHSNAAAGKPYVVQLPWVSAAPFNKEYLAGFEAYWRALGSQIGAPAEPVAVPLQVVEHTQIRAVSVRPEIARRVTPVDMNIVFQHLSATDPDQKFDLIVGTNIFIYYAAFEQSLARVNLAAMLTPGGFALTNDLLDDKATSHLEEAHRTIIEISSQPQVFDRIYCYRRQP